MSKRLSLEDCHKAAAEHDGYCLATEYVGYNVKMQWQCKSGHIFPASLDYIKNGKTWCPQCNRDKKYYTLEEYQDFAKDRLGKCLSEKWGNCHTKIEWECKNGHRFFATFSTVRISNEWCPICRKNSIKEDAILRRQEIAKERGGQCLTKEYHFCRDKLEWVCCEGHHWFAPLDATIAGRWCPRCANMVKPSIEECRRIATENGGLCFSTEYLNNKTKMEWGCNLGHRWRSSLEKIRSHKYWCIKCHDGVSISTCQELAYKKEGFCLSKDCKNVSDKLEWQCKFGHKWFSSLAIVKRGHWCRQCLTQTRRLSLEQCIQVAEKHEGKCLSKEYTSNDTDMEWQCKFGHVWVGTFSQMRYANSWCPQCAPNKKHTLQDCIDFAKTKNGECLSSGYENIKKKMEWRCQKGHTWSASFHCVFLSETWCPKCKPKSKNQDLLFDIIKNIFPNFPAHYNYRNFSWLRGRSRCFQELDIYISGLKLAIEYNGKQHYKPIKLFGGIKGFEKTKRLDHLKYVRIKRHPDDVKYFIRFNYKEKITKEYVIEKLKSKGVIKNNICEVNSNE